MSAALAIGVSGFVPTDALAGNNFPGTTISGNSGTLTASNTTATGQSGEPTTYGGGSLNSMWYSWTAPSNGSLTLQTCGGSTNFDTTLQTFTGSVVNALSQVATNDDACGLQSSNTISVTSGTTYRVQVDGYGSSTGTFTLSWTFTPTVVVPPAPTAVQACSALTGAWSGGAATSGGIGVTRSLGASGGGVWDPTTAGAMNTINAWSSAAVQGNASIVDTFLWNGGPTSSSGNLGTYTINFGKPVTNPVIHIDRIGGTATTGTSNSSRWVLTSAGTLFRLAGPAHFETFSDNSIIRTIGQATVGTESSLNGANGTGAGSVMISGTHSSVAFRIEGHSPLNEAGGDAFEVVVCAPQADLALAKVVDNASPTTGSNVTFTLTLTNSGADAAPGVEVTDLLPAGLSFVSATPSQGTYNSGTGVWNVGTVANGASPTLQIVANVTGSGTITNTAEVTASGVVDPDSDPGDGAGDDQASVALSVAAPVNLTCPTGSSGTGSGFASGGSGSFTQEVFWLDWNCSGTGIFPAGSTVNKSWDVGNGTIISASVTGLTRSIQSYNTGAYFEDTLPSLYGGLNPIGLRGSVDGEDPQFNISFSATHNGVSIPLDYVFADAETTSPGESIVVSTSGSAFTLLEQAGGVAVSGAGTGTATISNGGSAGTALLESTGSPTFTTTLNQGGLQAVAFGVRFKRDFSDAPVAGYGGANHRVLGNWRLGAAVTTELADYDDPNAAGDADDGTLIAGLVQGETATLAATVSGPGGLLQWWIDWNGDGDWADAGEQVATDFQDGGTGDIDGTVNGVIQFQVTVPPTAITTQTFARLRWSTTSGLGSTGSAPDGEVEDHAFVIAAGNPTLSVSKVATFDLGAGIQTADGSSDNVPVGTTVTYTYTVENTGNQTITGITLADLHAGTGTGPVPDPDGATLTDNGTTGDSSNTTTGDSEWDVLGPGDIITVTATYAVTQTDVDTLQ